MEAIPWLRILRYKSLSPETQALKRMCHYISNWCLATIPQHTLSQLVTNIPMKTGGKSFFQFTLLKTDTPSAPTKKQRKENIGRN